MTESLVKQIASMDNLMLAWRKIENLFVPGDFATGRHTNFGGVKEQVINDLGWAISSGWTAGNAAAPSTTRQSMANRNIPTEMKDSFR